jgi:hypothetical protein
MDFVQFSLIEDSIGDREAYYYEIWEKGFKKSLFSSHKMEFKDYKCHPNLVMSDKLKSSKSDEYVALIYRQYTGQHGRSTSCSMAIYSPKTKDIASVNIEVIHPSSEREVMIFFNRLYFDMLTRDGRNKDNVQLEPYAKKYLDTITELCQNLKNKNLLYSLEYSASKSKEKKNLVLKETLESNWDLNKVTTKVASHSVEDSTSFYVLNVYRSPIDAFTPEYVYDFYTSKGGIFLFSIRGKSPKKANGILSVQKNILKTISENEAQIKSNTWIQFD